MMRAPRTLAHIALLLLLAPAAAAAQEGHGLGLGAGVLSVGSDMLGAPLAISYDTGPLLFDVYLGFARVAEEMTGGEGDLGLLAGASAHYVVHQAAQADLGVGLGVGYLRLRVGGLGEFDDGESDGLLLSLDAKIRVFLASNVALTAGAGLGAHVHQGDDTLALGGRLVGVAGLIYYFE
jgi:hypothetical protein